MTVADALGRAAAEERPRIVATLIRVTRDWDLAEDCVQDAFARALLEWPRSGVPTSPGAWLTTVAKRRAIDRLRRQTTETLALRDLALMTELESLGSDGEPTALEDDRLRLIFTCCHPALAMDARVALTLRTVAGLTTAEIARAFLVPEATMAKRLVRARAKIRGAGIPYRVPPAHLLPQRLTGVLAVLYLLFNEGYSASGGSALVREPLVAEAIRVARLLVALLGDGPATAEAHGLLALMLLHSARTSSRTDAAGDVVTLEEQDRTGWDAERIASGVRALDAAARNRLVSGAPAGVYELQAAIARCHAEAPDAAATDFARIAILYDQLATVSPSPVVELNRAVAVAMARGPAAGLALVEQLDATGALDGYYLLPAALADLLRRLGRHPESAEQYRRALGLAPSDTERRYLTRRLGEAKHPAAVRSSKPRNHHADHRNNHHSEGKQP